MSIASHVNHFKPTMNTFFFLRNHPKWWHWVYQVKTNPAVFHNHSTKQSQILAGYCWLNPHYPSIILLSQNHPIIIPLNPVKSWLNHHFIRGFIRSFQGAVSLSRRLGLHCSAGIGICELGGPGLLQV